MAGALVAVMIVVLGGSGAARAQENPLEPLDTSSPQATYISFVEQVERLEGLLQDYEQERSEATETAYRSALSKAGTLFDLSDVPEANRREVAVRSVTSLADIVNRIPAPAIDDLPDADDVAAAEQAAEVELSGTELQLSPAGGGITDVTLPATEITITRIDEGSRSGEYLFSAETVSRLPGWRDDVEDVPLNEGVEVRDWVQAEADFTGHLMPRALVDAMPDALDRDAFGSPFWKLIVDVLVLLGIVGVTVLWHRTVGRQGAPDTIARYLARLTTPSLLVVLMSLGRRFMDEQVNHGGDVAALANLFVTFVIWASLAWGAWIITGLVVEWIIATPRIKDESVDAHLLRLLGKVVGAAAVFVFAWTGLARLGVPTGGLGIGAGIIGLAVGLAAQSTLENLLGGITVYADRPFRVGNWIRIADDFGKVEEIGPRSTRIRRLDDTRVVLPNADISRARIVNFSERRRILFVHEIGVRFETTGAQLQRIVEDIDSRFRAHPKVLDGDEYPRVRISGFAESAIEIEVRAHVDTNDFHVFTGVQQELLLLIQDVVEGAGSGFAFPSTTAYLTEDGGLPEPSDHEAPNRAVGSAG